MGKQRVLADRQPQVLSSPPDVTDPPARQRCGEVLRTSQMPARGARVEDLDAREPAPADVPLQAEPDALHLWQFRHSSPLGILATPGAAWWPAPGPRPLDPPREPGLRQQPWQGRIPRRSGSR